MTATHPTPLLLFVHNGSPYDAHITHLTAAGLRVADVHADAAVAEAVRTRPDIIVLDGVTDDDVTAQLNNHEATRHIPVIALVEPRMM